MPNYTEIPQEFREQYKKKFDNLDMDKIPELAGIQSSGTINFNIKNEIKQIEEKC